MRGSSRCAVARRMKEVRRGGLSHGGHSFCLFGRCWDGWLGLFDDASRNGSGWLLLDGLDLLRFFSLGQVGRLFGRGQWLDLSGAYDFVDFGTVRDKLQISPNQTD